MKPIRTCAACRKRAEKSALLRIVKGETFAVDPRQCLPGRGAYLCPDCVAAAIARKSLNRAFRCNVPAEFYRDLEDYVHGEKDGR